MKARSWNLPGRCPAGWDLSCGAGGVDRPGDRPWRGVLLEEGPEIVAGGVAELACLGTGAAGMLVWCKPWSAFCCDLEKLDLATAQKIIDSRV